MDADPNNNNVNSIRLRVELAKIYFKKKMYFKVKAECRRIQTLRISPELKKRVKEELVQTDKLFQIALSKQ